MRRNDGYHNRGGKNRNSNNRNKNNDNGGRRQQERRRSVSAISQKESVENENAIRAFKANCPICEICGEPIREIECAIANKGTENPVHFECVIKKLLEKEHPNSNERLSYIGQGRFAIIHYDNPHDIRHFSIKKIIEWENREKRSEWRDEMARLYSRIR